MSFDVSSFSTAIVQGMIEARNPMHKLVLKSFEDDSAKAELELDMQREVFIEHLQRKLTRAKENGADDSVIQAYIRLLEKHSGKAA